MIWCEIYPCMLLNVITTRLYLNLFVYYYQYVYSFLTVYFSVSSRQLSVFRDFHKYCILYNLVVYDPGPTLYPLFLYSHCWYYSQAISWRGADLEKKITFLILNIDPLPKHILLANNIIFKIDYWSLTFLVLFHTITKILICWI